MHIEVALLRGQGFILRLVKPVHQQQQQHQEERRGRERVRVRRKMEEKECCNGERKKGRKEMQTMMTSEDGMVDHVLLAVRSVQNH